MGNEIKAGCVCKTEFVVSNSSIFTGYIDYIDRDNATRNEHINSYSTYSDYMDNPEKTTSLFSATSNNLTDYEKQQYKQYYEDAQKNGSPMWQTVISFDNRWLEKNGLLDLEFGTMQIDTLKRYTREAIEKMLKNEGLELAVWTAAFHYNTDNLHVHIATVEKNPTREKIKIRTIRFYPDFISKNNIVRDENIDFNTTVGAHKSINYCYRKIYDRLINELVSLGYDKRSFGDYITINSNGSVDLSFLGNNNEIPYCAKLIDEHEEYRGKFKQKSIDICRSVMNNRIAEQCQANNQIITMLRTTITTGMKDNILFEEKDIANQYMKIYNSLIKSGINKSNWQYGQNKLAFVRSELDKITEIYLSRHLSEDYELYKQYAQENSEIYTEAYGKSNRNNFYQNKMKDLYKRCGNVILENMKNRNSEEIKEFSHNDYIAAEADEAAATGDNIDFDGNISYSSGKYRIKYWNNTFKNAKEDLKYALELGQEDYEEKSAIINNVVKVYEAQAELGNSMASFELGRNYELGTFGKINKDLSEKYYKQAFNEFKTELALNDKYYFDNLKNMDEYRRFMRSHPEYRNKLEQAIKNNDEIEWIRNFLEYKLGRMYVQGQGTEKNITKGIEHLKESDNPFAYYSLGNIYYHGYTSDTETISSDYKLAYDYFSQAGFTDTDEKEISFAIYNMAEMIENDFISDDRFTSDYLYSKALSMFLEEEEIEPNDQTEYKIGIMYQQGKGCSVDLDKAEQYLFSSAVFGNTYAQVKLADIYENSSDASKIEKAIILLEIAAEGNNPIAQYKLGKIYTDKEHNKFNLNEGIRLLEKSAEQNNEFAQYRLGRLYLEGELVKQDTDKAFEYLNASAAQNNQFAQYALGNLYLKGELIEFDLYQALIYLEASAAQNNSFAQYKLGILNYKGEYIEQNIDNALEYLSSSAEQGNQFAQYTLGYIYLKGEVTNKNSSLAIKLLTASAEQGNQFAQYQLGKLYYFGNDDIAQNRELAIEYLNASAEQGNEYAIALLNWKPQSNLGVYRDDFNATERLIGFASNIREMFENLANEHQHMLNQMIYESLLHKREKSSEQNL